MITSSNSLEALERLNHIVKAHNLGKPVLWNKRMQNGLYIASIKVCGQEFICYPNEFADPTDAYECAAKDACKYFESKLPLWMKPAL